MTACKFSRSHAVALWNTLRMWWVLFPQDTWTSPECCFYYCGLGKEVTKQLCLPRWLASNQSYDSWSKAPCCIFPFWGKNANMSASKSLYSCPQKSHASHLDCHWLMAFLSFPDQTSYFLSYNRASICLEPPSAWTKSVRAMSLSPELYSSMYFRRVIIQVFGW